MKHEIRTSGRNEGKTLAAKIQDAVDERTGRIKEIRRMTVAYATLTVQRMLEELKSQNCEIVKFPISKREIEESIKSGQIVVEYRPRLLKTAFSVKVPKDFRLEG